MMKRTEKKKKDGYRSQLSLIIFRFKKNKLGIVGLIILAVLFLICFSSPLWISYRDITHQNIREAFLRPGENGHIFGTDQYGRDLFYRVIYGGMVSLLSGFAIVGVSLLLGLLFGGIAGYAGGKPDSLIMRAIDVFMSVPSILMQMTIIVSLGHNIVNLYIAMAVVMFPGTARLVRSTILTVRDREFVEAAKSYGTSPLTILIRHVLPNGIGPVIVNATLSLGSAILAIAGMGFIGLGIPAPTPEWGTILAENRDMIRYYPYMGVIPGLAIGISVMALNFVGDGLRDALDPRTKK